MGSSHVADGEPDPFEPEPNGPRPCIYCGTTIDDEGRQVDGERRMHSVEQCREYVKAALMSYVRERAELVRELRVAVILANCHYNDRPCGQCQAEIDALAPSGKRGDPWSAVALGEAP